MRLRALAAFLGCLAVLAGGLASVAARTVLPASPAQAQTTIAEQPCSHCDGCDTASCPMPAPSCLQVSSSAALNLATATFDPPAMDADKVRWSLSTTFLTGLSPPPDPFPPRA